MYCLFCDDIIYVAKKEENRNVQQTKALNTFKRASKERNDERISNLLENVELPFMVHRHCASIVCSISYCSAQNLTPLYEGLTLLLKVGMLYDTIRTLKFSFF